MFTEHLGFLETANAVFSGDYNRTAEKASSQLGSLGSGNHFIELCLDEEDNVWVMLHSGSRGIGNMIGRAFIEKAKQEMERWHIHLPDNDLAYLPEGSEHFDSYVSAVDWAQNYAKMNRELMFNVVVNCVSHALKRQVNPSLVVINCHHNYVELENHFGENVYVTRKGAVRAREGDFGIIPGSMGARSFIVVGKGNKESFCSCSHGAGRKMSRSEAKKKFTVEDLQAATAGVECRKDADVIDEIPQAYKDIDEVMNNQSDLVDRVAILRQVLCVKG
jgi:tRNA-splicing ligase RtcB